GAQRLPRSSQRSPRYQDTGGPKRAVLPGSVEWCVAHSRASVLVTCAGYQQGRRMSAFVAMADWTPPSAVSLLSGTRSFELPGLAGSREAVGVAMKSEARTKW